MEQMPKKISQIKLSDFTYDIDVANNLKATKLIGEQLTKVAPVKAILKPDGQYDFFDENNKISSHYISDTILGQLKFGGTIAYDGADIFSINPSTLFYERALEFEATKESPSGESFSNPILVASYGELGITLAILGDWGNGSSPLFNNDLVNLEGFYFILTTPSDPYTGNSPEEILIPKSNIGDWWVICGGKIEKIDNTDTITHIDETDGTSLLEITGSSGLKLNGITADGSDLVTEKTFISRTNDSYQGSRVTVDGFSTWLGGLASATYGPANIEIVTPLGTTTITGNTINTEGSISAPTLIGDTVQANSKMTAPTISDKTDKSQVVNLEYFENNATKVDWENIDSEVHVINNHNVEIDGGLVVHCKSDITRVDISSLGDEQTCAYEPYVQSDGTASWYNDSNLTQPYWLRFPITAGYGYEVTGKPEYTPSFFKNASGAGHLVVTAASEGAALNIVEYSYAASAQDEDYTTVWYGKGTIYFTADITGYAYIPTSDSVMYHGNSISTSKYNITEIQGSAPRVKIEGDLEITGDLSFGADSHLVFGTIEGTDFIADSAKVKNAPVEDDDVVNKAYFDANKGSGGGSSDISDYQGNAKINGNLEVTGNLSFEGDLEMSSIEAQSIKINGKRVLTEDDLANLVAYPAAEDYTF